MIYCLVKDGVVSERLWDFDTPPSLPHKNRVWMPFKDERSPTFDATTHKLGDVTRLIENGFAVWRRSPVALTAAEKTENAIHKRATEYAKRTNAHKGAGVGPLTAAGYWIDALAGEIEAIRNGEPQTQEFTALLAIREAVKTDVPK